MPWCGTAVSALHQQWGWCGLAAGHQHWSEIYLQSAPVYYLHLKYGVYWTTLVVVLHLWILHLKMVFLSCFNPGVQGCTLQYCFMTLNDVHYAIKIAAWESAGTRKIKSRWPDVELRCPHCTNNGDDAVLQQAINTDLKSTSNLHLFAFYTYCKNIVSRI